MCGDVLKEEEVVSSAQSIERFEISLEEENVARLEANAGQLFDAVGTTGGGLPETVTGPPRGNPSCGSPDEVRPRGSTHCSRIGSVD